jgi:hypothetical protein
VRGQWTFGGVARQTGKTFLVAVQDGMAETLMAVVKEWILPGYHSSDFWVMHRRMKDTAMTISHSILFMNPETGADMNTTESRWHHVKATLNPYNRKCDHMHHLVG